MYLYVRPERAKVFIGGNTPVKHQSNACDEQHFQYDEKIYFSYIHLTEDLIISIY